MKIDIRFVENAIGYTFKDKENLINAFTHSSMKKFDSDCENYERMEFLGDAILGFVVAEYLYVHFEDLSEGEMTTFRTKLVSKTPLSEIISNMGNSNSVKKKDNEGIARFISFGNGSSQSMLNDKIRADLYESIVAAIYLDSGMDNAKEYILRTLSDILLDIGELDAKDDRSKLQEYCAKNHLSWSYNEIGSFGADNEKIFEYEVYVNGERCGAGKGNSKKLAQQFAAKEAVQKLRID